MIKPLILRGEDSVSIVGSQKYDNYVRLQHLQHFSHSPASHYTVKYVP